jgi:hypothetical protein
MLLHNLSHQLSIIYYTVKPLSIVPGLGILFQLWLPHLLFSQIHCFFFRPPDENDEYRFHCIQKAMLPSVSLVKIMVTLCCLYFIPTLLCITNHVTFRFIKENQVLQKLREFHLHDHIAVPYIYIYIYRNKRAPSTLTCT